MVAFGETLRKVGYHAVKRLLSSEVEIGVSGGSGRDSDWDDEGGGATADAGAGAGATEGMIDVLLLKRRESSRVE